MPRDLSLTRYTVLIRFLTECPLRLSSDSAATFTSTIFRSQKRNTLFKRLSRKMTLGLGSEREYRLCLSIIAFPIADHFESDCR